MKEDISMEVHSNVANRTTEFRATINDHNMMARLSGEILREIGCEVVRRYVDEHYVDIIKHLDVKQIADLATLEVAKEVLGGLRKGRK